MAVYNAPTSVIDAVDRRGVESERGLGGANTSQIGSFLEGLVGGATSAANIGASLANTQAQLAQTAATYDPERLAMEQLERELKNKQLAKATSLYEQYGERKELATIAGTEAAAQLNTASAAGLRQKQAFTEKYGDAEAQAEIDLQRAQAYRMRNPIPSASAQAKQDELREAERQRRATIAELRGEDGVPELEVEPELTPEQQELQAAGQQYGQVASQFQHSQAKGEIYKQTNQTNVQAKAQEFSNKLEVKGIGLTDLIAGTGEDMLQAAGDVDPKTQQPNFRNGLENLLMLDQSRQLATSEEQRALASATIAQGLKAFPSTDSFIDAIEADPDKTPEEKEADKRAFYKAVYAGDKTNLPKQQKSLADAGFAPENVADTPQTYDRIGLGIANKWDAFDDPDLKKVIRTDPYVAAASMASKNGEQGFTAKMELVSNNNPADVMSGSGSAYQMVFRGNDGTQAVAPVPNTDQGHAMLSVLDVVAKKQQQVIVSKQNIAQQNAGIEARSQQLIPQAQPQQQSQVAAPNARPTNTPVPQPTPSGNIDVATTPQQVAEADVVGAPNVPTQQPQAQPTVDKQSNNYIDNRAAQKRFPEVTVLEGLVDEQKMVELDAADRIDRQTASNYNSDRALEKATEAEKNRKASFAPIIKADEEGDKNLAEIKQFNTKVRAALEKVEKNKLEGLFGKQAGAERGIRDLKSNLPNWAVGEVQEAYNEASELFKNIGTSEIQKAAQISGPRSVDSPVESGRMAELAPSMKTTYETAKLLDQLNQNQENFIKNSLMLTRTLQSSGLLKGRPITAATVQRLKSEYKNDKNSAKFIVGPDGTVIENDKFQDADTWLRTHTNYQGAQPPPPASSGGTPPSAGGSFPAPSTPVTPTTAASSPQAQTTPDDNMTFGGGRARGGSGASNSEILDKYPNDPTFKKEVEEYKKLHDPATLLDEEGSNVSGEFVDFSRDALAGTLPGFIRRPIREAAQSLKNMGEDALFPTTPRAQDVRAQAQLEMNKEQDESFGHAVGEMAQMVIASEAGASAISKAAEVTGALGKAAEGTGAVSRLAKGALNIAQTADKVLKTSQYGDTLLKRTAARLARGATLDNLAMTAVEMGEAGEDQEGIWRKALGENAVIGAVGNAVLGPLAGSALAKTAKTDIGVAVRAALGSRDAAFDSLAKQLSKTGVDFESWVARAKEDPIKAIGELKGAAREIVDDVITNPKSQEYLNSKIPGTDKTVKQTLSEQNAAFDAASQDRAGVRQAPDQGVTSKAFREEVGAQQAATDIATESKIRTEQAAAETLATRQLSEQLDNTRAVFEEAANTDLQGAINDFGKSVGVPIEDLPTVNAPLGKGATPQQVDEIVKNYRKIAETVESTKRDIYQKSSGLIDQKVATEEGPQIMSDLMKALRTDPQGNPEMADNLVKQVLSKADNETLGGVTSKKAQTGITKSKQTSDIEKTLESYGITPGKSNARINEENAFTRNTSKGPDGRTPLDRATDPNRFDYLKSNRDAQLKSQEELFRDKKGIYADAYARDSMYKQARKSIEDKYQRDLTYERGNIKKFLKEQHELRARQKNPDAYYDEQGNLLPGVPTASGEVGLPPVPSKVPSSSVKETLADSRLDMAAQMRNPANAGIKKPQINDEDLPTTVGFLNEMREWAKKGLQGDAGFSANNRAVELIDEAANRLTNNQWSKFTKTYRPLTQNIEKLNKAADYIDDIRNAMRNPKAAASLSTKLGERSTNTQSKIEDIVGTEGRDTVLKAAEDVSNTQKYIDSLRKKMSKPIPEDVKAAEYSEGLKRGIRLSEKDEFNLGETVLGSSPESIDLIKSGIPNGDKLVKDGVLRAVKDRFTKLQGASAKAPEVGDSAAKYLGFDDAEVAAIKHALGGDKQVQGVIDTLLNEQVNVNSYRNFLESYESLSSKKSGLGASTLRHVIYSGGGKVVLDILSTLGGKASSNRASLQATKLLFNPDPATTTANIVEMSKRLSNMNSLKGYRTQDIKAALIDMIARNAYYEADNLTDRSNEEAHQRAMRSNNAKQVIKNLQADKAAIRK